MNIFFDIGRHSVNTGKIKVMEVARKYAVRITFDDGDTDIFSTGYDAERVIESIGKTILQLIPCVTPVYNVYDNGDGTYFHEPVSYLALCSDGVIRSLATPDGFFELAETASNFRGCYEKHRLVEFPKG